MQIRVYSRPVFDKEERREEDRKNVCVLCMRLCVREKQSNMRLRDLGGQTLIPPGACWVSLQ